MPTSADPTTYQPPRLRLLGAVDELTQGGISVAASDGVLFGTEGGGRKRAVNGS